MNKRSFLERFALVPHAVWSILFIVAPLIFIIYFAFTDRNGNFTFANVTSLSNYANIFGLSVAFALIATVICLLVGYPLAFFISRLKPSKQKIMILLLMLPMWISLLIRTYSLMTLLDNGGLLNSLLNAVGFRNVQIVGTAGAVILGMVYDFLPYMVLPIYTSMSKLDIRYFEAAEDLGCNGWKTLRRVVLPLTVPGIISGITMVFVPSISTFYISQKLGGGSFDLIGDTIERQFMNKSYNVGAAISLVMMILILISVAVMNKFADDDKGGQLIV
ncbi:MAG: ABC transporter permease [Clostridia bacterium]|nr:ABC transporter permease [Clostridia bacterium]MBQ3870333.1 ABC transporter permease [Clostridia bacterium]